MDTSIAVIIGAAVGSGVTGVFGFITIQLQRRSEERRQIRELAVKVAFEHFAFHKDCFQRYGGTLLPLDAHLIYAVSLVSALDGSISTDSQVRDYLKKAYALADAAKDEIDIRTKKIKTEGSKSAA